MRFFHNRLWFLALAVFALCMASCKGSPTKEPAPSLAFREAKKGNEAKEGNKVPTGNLSCPQAETFSNPGLEDPEYPLAEIYRAALMPDGEQAFMRFVSQFVSSLDARFLREQQWPRVRKHVRKYVQDPEAFSFQLCRREVKADGAIKVFVRSFDERKSNPPCTIVEVDGHWKVKFFTY